MGQSKALLVLDTQVNMFGDDFHVYDCNRILETIDSLTKKARATGAMVIYVRNNGGAGEPDELGTPGWEIHKAVAPQEGDMILDKSSPDAFENTTLRGQLDQREITELVVVGMQTDLCVADTCRRAHELNYDVTLVEDAHTTFDWEEITAVDSIAQVNKELSALIKVKPAARIEF